MSIMKDGRYDFHIHSSFSGDSTAAVDDMCRGAIAAGLAGICFTDHHDLGIVTDEALAYVKEHGINYGSFKVSRPDEYAAAVFAARDKFPEIEVLLGIELGTTTVMDEEGFGILDELPLDYLLMSCHDAGGIDPAVPLCFEGKTREEAIEVYLKSIYDGMMCLDSFDGLAHIGYIYRYMKRYGLYGDDGWRYRRSDGPEILDAILRRTIDVGAALELNMSGYADGYTMPHAYIVKRFVELGGETAIYASDAHAPQDIGRHYDEAIGIMRSAGIKYLARYKQRQQILTRI